MSLSVWGIPDGCKDNSDKVKDANTNNTDNPCGGDEYSYYVYDRDQEKYITKIGKATWEWFHCKKTGKCIPHHLKCDTHPHPACFYKDKNNNTIAEDEEDCSEKKVFYQMFAIWK